MKKWCLILATASLMACAPAVINPSTEKYEFTNYRSYPLSSHQSMEMLLHFFANNHFEVEANKGAGKIELVAHVHLYDLHQIMGAGLQRVDTSIPELNTSLFKLGIADCGKGISGDVVSPNLAQITVNVEPLGQHSVVSVETLFRYTHQKIRPGEAATAVPNGYGGYSVYGATATSLEGPNIACQSTGVIERLILGSIIEKANGISQAGQGRFVKIDMREHLPPKRPILWMLYKTRRQTCIGFGLDTFNANNPLFTRYSDAHEGDNTAFVNGINRINFTERHWRQPTPEELSQLSSVITDGFSLTKRGWFLTLSHLANGTNQTMYLVFFGGKAESLDYVAVAEIPVKK